ncbi:MAG: ATP-binding protein [Anaerolineae bacterium]
MTSEYEICVSSQVEHLAEIAAFVSSQAARAGMSEDEVFAVQMAVDEACTNSMEHAYEGRTDGMVRVCCAIEADGLTVRIIDFGKPFDPTSVPTPDVSAPLEERGIGGLGLFFMRRLMDEVEFRFDAVRGNEVIMRKHRSRA